MSAYYNEFDPHAAAWLRQLIKEGLIASGEVDERSILEVHPDDLKGFTQCHFFAGIGGWSYALRLAGWPDDRPIWTGSCPCQPFSTAGKQKGTNDDRHLWPDWFYLISQCRPATIFGEQVEAAIRHGWLDLVQTDLEGIGCAVGAVGLPASCVGAPHLRQRLWFVADANSKRCDGEQIRLCKWGQEPTGAEIAWNGGATFTKCRDGKARPISIEPAFLPLADGVSPARVGILRGAGNAIVPQVAAAFIKAYMEAAEGLWR